MVDLYSLPPSVLCHHLKVKWVILARVLSSCCSHRVCAVLCMTIQTALGSYYYVGVASHWLSMHTNSIVSVKCQLCPISLSHYRSLVLVNNIALGQLAVETKIVLYGYQGPVRVLIQYTVG